ncbi:hypothetical protein EDD39_1103 [Kitasatospora cineracea]|uniref:Uncharacterized protein n=1 Tax=Kitasatospora cineracea TaxID=88074 RepID=A0A8G1UFC8_9ACTN|nr:hypothetical protein EDD39_1103 [Kitasatospora cineracea]
MAARKPPAKTTAPVPAATPAPESAAPEAEQPAAAPIPAAEASAAAPLEPPPVPPEQPEPRPEGPVPGITLQAPASAADSELVDENGSPLPGDPSELFDLTHPEWTVVFPKVRIYERRTVPGSRRTVTHLLYIPAKSVPRAEFDRLRQARGWE